MRKRSSIVEGQVKKGGQNPPNTSSARPVPPEGSGGSSTRKAMFVRALAEYLVGDQVQKSIELQLGKAEAQVWAKVRGLTPLMGYPSIDEAEQVLTAFLR